MPRARRVCSVRRCQCMGTVHKLRSTLTSTERGYGRRWRRESKAFLAQPGNDRCHLRLARSCEWHSTMVHHERAPRMGAGTLTEQEQAERLFWDRSYWVPSCGPCNTVVANRQEDAGRG